MYVAITQTMTVPTKPAYLMKKLRSFRARVITPRLPRCLCSCRAAPGYGPKSTRDLVNEAFGFDPSLPRGLRPPTMKQAMFMMSNTQLQKQIDASPESDTVLSRLLKAEKDDAAVVRSLYFSVLAREPKDKETKLNLAHVRTVKDRGAAFEDILWSLVNSAEFTSRR